MPSSSIIIKKKSGEKLAVGMDFGPWMTSGDTISTINDVTTDECADASAITITNEVISGTNVNFFVDGGTAGIRYTVIVNITTSAGETLIGDGQLVIT